MNKWVVTMVVGTLTLVLFGCGALKGDATQKLEKPKYIVPEGNVSAAQIFQPFDNCSQGMLMVDVVKDYVDPQNTGKNVLVRARGYVMAEPYKGTLSPYAIMGMVAQTPEDRKEKVKFGSLLGLKIALLTASGEATGVDVSVDNATINTSRLQVVKDPESMDEGFVMELRRGRSGGFYGTDQRRKIARDASSAKGKYFTAAGQQGVGEFTAVKVYGHKTIPEGVYYLPPDLEKPELTLEEPPAGSIKTGIKLPIAAPTAPAPEGVVAMLQVSLEPIDKKPRRGGQGSITKLTAILPDSGQGEIVVDASGFDTFSSKSGEKASLNPGMYDLEIRRAYLQGKGFCVQTGAMAKTMINISDS